MKLWWVHSEAMIALVMAYKNTNQPKYWDKFKEVADYSYRHVRNVGCYVSNTYSSAAVEVSIEKSIMIVFCCSFYLLSLWTTNAGSGSGT